jgi:hypothetical protein
MAALIKQIIVQLTSKLGGVGGMIVSYVLQFFGAKLADYLNELYKNYERKQKQNEAKAKVIEDVKTQAPRSEEVKKNEKDFLNS